MLKFSDKQMDEAFKAFMGQRIQDCYTNNVLKDAEHQKWSHQLSSLHKEIIDILGPEHEGLIFDYDLAEGLRFGIEQDASYRQGFSDGMNFILRTLTATS